MTPERFTTRFHNALDRLHVGFQVLSFDWHYIYVNPAAAAHGRRAVAELEGKSMLDLYPGIEDTAMFRVLERCMNDRVADEFDNLFTYPDGESRWLEIRVEPVSEGICIYSNDIHERKLWQLEMEVKARALGVRPPLTQHQWRSFVSGDFTES
jgi:PAS domain S-box-containing protein